ncbi:Cu(I)-responsive transcriptional regulator [Pseudopelagicola sp. nBUS_20]|uniref:Cu(I)-responsive transcriptional regulator n=1 Tax=Pseudopelagicola sp. nBUS_20 TaxID=3395317 RepID=UPI003EC01615
MNIGEVSKKSGLASKTIRYYESIGFIAPERGKNGYRIFNDQDLHRLTFIGRARSLGFTIENCRSLLALYSDKTRASAAVKIVAQSNLCEIDAKIDGLQAMRTTLAHLIGACAGDERPDCPILNDLGSREKHQ